MPWLGCIKWCLETTNKRFSSFCHAIFTWRVSLHISLVLSFWYSHLRIIWSLVCLSIFISFIYDSESKDLIFLFSLVNHHNLIRSLQVDFAFRLAFRRSFSADLYCDAHTVASKGLISSGVWQASSPGYSYTVGNASYHCTEFSAIEDWSAGQNQFSFTFPHPGPWHVRWASHDALLAVFIWTVRLCGEIDCTVMLLLTLALHSNCAKEMVVIWHWP